MAWLDKRGENYRLVFQFDGQTLRFEFCVSRLEEQGWVRRETVESDRRGAVAALTEAGLAALEAAAPVHVEGVRRHVFDQLTPDQIRALGEISRTLHDHLEAATPAG